jgi:hypothetical protein
LLVQKTPAVGTPALREPMNLAYLPRLTDEETKKYNADQYMAFEGLEKATRVGGE